MDGSLARSARAPIPPAAFAVPPEEEDSGRDHDHALDRIGLHHRDEPAHGGVGHHDDEHDGDRRAVGDLQKALQQVADPLKDRRHVQERSEEDDDGGHDPATGLPKRKPMKSGIVRDPRDSVKVRRRGATATQAKRHSPTMKGTSTNQVTPHSYPRPAKPTKELVLE